MGGGGWERGKGGDVGDGGVRRGGIWGSEKGGGEGREKRGKKEEAVLGNGRRRWGIEEGRKRMGMWMG